MDPIAHTMTGAALARGGLRRTTPLATATLILAANAPDVDVFVYFFGSMYSGLAFRRGWTHGLPAMVIWPLAVTGVVLLWDRLARRRRDPRAAAAQPFPLLAVATAGVLTHPTLDWLNNYGMRWLMPFDGRWFYGDALFIVDPWVWLLLGGGLMLGYSRSAAARVGWCLLAAGLTFVVLRADVVPPGAKTLWLAGVAGFSLLRAAGLGRATETTERDAAVERLVRGLGAAVVVYMLAMVAADRFARAEVRAVAGAAGLGPIESVMVAPTPANPLAGHVVVATPEAYHFGAFRWLERPRVVLVAESLSRAVSPAIVTAVATVPDVRDYLVWARFPFFEVTRKPDGYRVRIGDARYERGLGVGSLRGLVVELDENLKPRRRGGHGGRARNAAAANEGRGSFRGPDACLHARRVPLVDQRLHENDRGVAYSGRFLIFFRGIG